MYTISYVCVIHGQFVVCMYALMCVLCILLWDTVPLSRSPMHGVRIIHTTCLTVVEGAPS